MPNEINDYEYISTNADMHVAFAPFVPFIAIPSNTFIVGNMIGFSIIGYVLAPQIIGSALPILPIAGTSFITGSIVGYEMTGSYLAGSTIGIVTSIAISTFKKFVELIVPSVDDDTILIPATLIGSAIGATATTFPEEGGAFAGFIVGDVVAVLAKTSYECMKAELRENVQAIEGVNSIKESLPVHQEVEVAGETNENIDL